VLAARQSQPEPAEPNISTGFDRSIEVHTKSDRRSQEATTKIRGYRHSTEANNDTTPEQGAGVIVYEED
jgi:hypothetical protein